MFNLPLSLKQFPGLPNWRPKLPSRNWLIFIAVTSSWTGALLYDRRQKRLRQQKWCTLVSHQADDLLPTNKLPRRLTVFLEAPPGDSLRVAREHFLEYVKPVLVAAAVDWDVVEGRREGEIRAGLAERIRRKRRKAGETGGEPPKDEKPDVKTLIEGNRQRTGVEEWDGLGGDIIIGRHTWKEYVRGLHEGWLAPMAAPRIEANASAKENILSAEARAKEALRKKNEEEKQKSDVHAISDSDLLQTPEADPLPAKGAGNAAGDASPQADAPDVEKPKDPEPPPKPLVPPAHDSPASYPSEKLATSTPPEFAPSTAIPFPHLLGFLSTPTRMYRFLNRRQLADDIGRQTAAAVLGSHRFFQQHEPSVSTSSFNPESTSATDSQVTTDSHSNAWEQQDVLKHEEAEWHKDVRRRERVMDGPEREWSDPMTLDSRIASRMRKFEMDDEDEHRANRIAKGSEGIPGRKEDRRSDYEA